MNQRKDRAGRKAAGVAALLLLAGGLLGVLVDRLWLLRREPEAMPLTAQAMAARLDLSPSEEARIRALLDTIHAEVTVAVEHGPDSLRATAHSVQLRLEAALPADARPEFRAWMHEHHRRMMRRMGGTPMQGRGSVGSGATGLHNEHR